MQREPSHTTSKPLSNEKESILNFQFPKTEEETIKTIKYNKYKHYAICYGIIQNIILIFVVYWSGGIYDPKFIYIFKNSFEYMLFIFLGLLPTLFLYFFGNDKESLLICSSMISLQTVFMVVIGLGVGFDIKNAWLF